MPKIVSEMDVKPGTSAPAVISPEAEAQKLWIHCNRCCEQYVLKQSMFFLLACHHVTCEKCVKVCAGRTPSDAPIYECPVCHSKVRGRQVNNTMPNGFKLFFHPEPFSLNNEFIATFQRGNHRHFDSFKEKKGTKLNKLTKDVDLAKSFCQKRFFDLEHMRVERKSMSRQIRHIKSQAKRREEKEKEKRMAEERHHRNQTQPKPGPGYGQERHRATTVSPSVNKYRRNMSNTSSSSSTKHKQVTSFRHQPNYSFNL